ncbi:MAG: mechanosensitive ion channel [candidate division WOR-3 bacterium]|nr:mechanosensitive ion channel [candidate division WOR-3 bacterium]
MLWQKFWNEIYSRFVSPERIAHFLVKILTILLIVALGIIIYRIVTWILSRVLKKHQEPKALTIIPLTNSILKYLTFFIVLIAVLRELGVNYGAILAGAGVVGLAVGFGAQTLIRDIISGFFLLFENLISVGDVIEVGQESGVVERIGLRTTQFRDYSGVLRTIPNGELTRFGNYNRDFMRVLITVDFDYDSDIRKGMAVADKVAKEWAKNNPEIVLEEPEVQGILGFSPSGMTIRVVAKVKPQTQWDAERDLRRLLKLSFDEHGIKIPAERRMIYLQK